MPACCSNIFLWPIYLQGSLVEESIHLVPELVYIFISNLFTRTSIRPPGGLVGDNIYLVPERVKRLAARLKKWVGLRRTPPSQRRVALMLYGFPPGAIAC